MGETNAKLIIFHLVPHFGIGGDITIVKSMAKAQQAAGQVLINGLSPEEAFSEKRHENPFPLNERGIGMLRACRNLKLIPKGTSVLHTHSPICLVFALIARRFQCPDARIVFTFHWPVPDQGLRRWAKGWLFRQADVVHLYSSDTLKTMASRYGLPDSKVRFFPVGVDPDRFKAKTVNPDQTALRKRWNLPDNAKVLGYLGRLAEEKHCDFLIRFMQIHHSSFPDLHLVIAGTGDLSEKLHEEAQQGPAYNRIHLTGYTREPETVYPVFDLLILPSDFEAFPQVVIEAGYCAVPALRSDVEGSRDQIREGVTGFTYPHSGGYKAMETALLRILDSGWDSLPLIGAAARNHCLELCDMPRFASALAEMYASAKR